MDSKFAVVLPPNVITPALGFKLKSGTNAERCRSVGWVLGAIHTPTRRRSENFARGNINGVVEGFVAENWRQIQGESGSGSGG